MDLGYMGRLLLSFAIFAPGLILLAFLLFVGVIMLAEKANIFREYRRIPDRAGEYLARTDASNPEPGHITASLTDEIASATDDRERASEREAATVHELRRRD